MIELGKRFSQIRQDFLKRAEESSEYQNNDHFGSSKLKFQSKKSESSLKRIQGLLKSQDDKLQVESKDSTLY